MKTIGQLFMVVTFLTVMTMFVCSIAAIGSLFIHF